MQLGRYKRKDSKDSEQILMERMEQEYQLFRYKMLSRTVKEVYEDCAKIHFYECLHEYFLYQENIQEEFLEKAAKRKGIYQELWNLYLKYEHLEVSTWEQIEGMLKFYCYQEKGEEKNYETTNDNERIF